jgi:hypothetical protein
MTTRLFSLGLAIALTTTASLSGCFNPTIENGTLKCVSNIGCPSGYSCAANGFCYKSGDLDSLDLSVGPYRGTGALGDLVLPQNGMTTFNPESGEVIVNGNRVIAPNAPGFERTLQSTGEPVAIWNFTRFVVPPGMVVRPAEGFPAVIAIAATDEIIVDGAFVLDGYGYPGGGPLQAGIGAMGQAGGGAKEDASGPGGGGAGHGAAGGRGGAPFAMPMLGGMGGGIVGEARPAPIYLGAGGGGGGSTNLAACGPGGRGGGAVGLFARRIHLGGLISANGAPGNVGRANDGPSGGGGGGSGGMIVLAADEVELVGAGGGGGDGGMGAQLRARGGDGGRGGLDGHGMPNGGFPGGKGGDGRIVIGARMQTGSALTEPAATTLTAAQGGIPTTFPE